MSITRQHFEAIAKAVRDSEIDNNAKYVVASNLAGVLAPFSAQFQAGKFITAATGRNV